MYMQRRRKERGHENRLEEKYAVEKRQREHAKPDKKEAHPE
jgi:hypothetical protein